MYATDTHRLIIFPGYILLLWFAYPVCLRHSSYVLHRALLCPTSAGHQLCHAFDAEVSIVPIALHPHIYVTLGHKYPKMHCHTTPLLYVCLPSCLPCFVLDQARITNCAASCLCSCHRRHHTCIHAVALMHYLCHEDPSAIFFWVSVVVGIGPC